MKRLEPQLVETLAGVLQNLYQLEVDPASLKLEKTNPEYEGDITFVVFPYLKASRKGPEATATEMGEAVRQRLDIISGFEVVKGFLNFKIADAYWLQFLAEAMHNQHFFTTAIGAGQKVMVEYSSPNTNKPLHLGHVRNNFLGWSLAAILQANGYQVTKANLINDRGIHICKSMLAWMRFGNGETPESSGIKGDHLVGKYYVAFDKAYKDEVKQLVAEGISEEEAEKKAPILLEAQELLRKWEARDPETIRVWKTMNQWVYSGFERTYTRMGVDFDRYYYESDTYLLGKDIVQEGLDKGVFFKKDNGSVWVDLKAEGLDEKLVLRGDGTSVYITQDLGTADLKYKEYQIDRSVYVVGNEQDYHFKVLKSILEKLGRSYAPGIYHMSYGMVDLPSGKMKSREGTVVDADELMEEMEATAAQITKELGKTEGLEEEQLAHLYRILGQGALKYYLLKVDPVKRMLFNPQESIDFQGNTGPFIQYTYARINSVVGSAGKLPARFPDNYSLHSHEREVLVHLYRYPDTLAEAAKDYSPAVIANYAYDLAKLFNRFYHDLSVLKAESPEARDFRLLLADMTGKTIKESLRLLGIEAPARM